MKFTTFISGFNTLEAYPVGDIEKSARFMEEHFVQLRRTGQCKPETVRKIAADRGIVRGLSAEAVSYDTSGKGRHVIKKIGVAA